MITDFLFLQYFSLLIISINPSSTSNPLNLFVFRLLLSSYLRYRIFSQVQNFVSGTVFSLLDLTAWLRPKFTIIMYLFMGVLFCTLGLTITLVYIEVENYLLVQREFLSLERKDFLRQNYLIHLITLKRLQKWVTSPHFMYL